MQPYFGSMEVLSLNVKWISSLLIGLLLVTGCNDQSTMEGQHISSRDQSLKAQQIAYGLLGPGPINYGNIRKEPRYRFEGEENTSPSFKTMNRYRRHLGDDQQLIHHIIHDEFGLETGMVMLAGSHAFVSVTLPKGLSEEEKQEKLGKVKRALLQEVPRYRIHVREKNE